MRGRGLVALALGALAVSLVLPPIFTGLPQNGQRALAVTLITVILWTTRGLDSGATALLGVTLLALTGAAGGVRQALQGFANPVPYFLVGVLAMGGADLPAAVRHHPLRHPRAHLRRGVRARAGASVVNIRHPPPSLPRCVLPSL